MKILLGTGMTYRTHTLKETEDLALSLGYDGVEIMMPPRHHGPDEPARDTAYETLSRAEVIHAPGDMFDGPRFAASLEDGLALAQKIGVNILNTHPAALALGGRENVVQAIELIQKRRQETGITIAYEILVDPNGLGSERQDRFRGMQAHHSIEEWVEDVKRYDLAATLDTCHVGTWKKEPAKYVEQLGENLVHVHFSDYGSTTGTEHLIPGDGEVDLKSFLQELQAKRPSVTLTVEVIPGETKEENQENARRSIEFIRQVM